MALMAFGAMLTDTGREREGNEDNIAFLAPGAEGRALVIVADGMGGHAAGEVASRLAVETLVDCYQNQNGAPAAILAEAMRLANDAIQRYASEHRECAGMGTTCTAMAIEDDRAWLAHVGDSRAYLYRQGTLHQVSEDDSLVAALLRGGHITAEQAAARGDSNIILKALGTKPEVAPTIWLEGMPLLAGDVLLLCSDGLTDMVDDATMAALLETAAPYDACTALVEAANHAGGHDNISVGVIALIAEAEAASKRVPRTTRANPIPTREDDR